MSKNIKIKMPIVLYTSYSSFLTLKKEIKVANDVLINNLLELINKRFIELLDEPFVPYRKKGNHSDIAEMYVVIELEGDKKMGGIENV